MFCPNCGANLSPDAKFCPTCGASVSGAFAAAPQQDQQTASLNQQTAGGTPTPPSSYGQQQPHDQQQACGQQTQQIYGQHGGPNAGYPTQQPYDQQQAYGQQQPYGQHGGPNAGYPTQQPYNQQQYGQQPYGAANQGQAQKKSSRPVIIVVIIAAVVAIALICAFAFGVFSPGKGSGSSAAVQPTASSASQAASASSAAAPSASSAAAPSGGSAAAPSAAPAGSSNASAPTSSGDATPSNAGSAASSSTTSDLQAAKDNAFAQGYEVFEGTVRVLSTSELCSMQGVDQKMFTQEGTFAVLIFDAPIQVSGMSGDGSGSRRQGGSMLGLAEHTDYGSSVIDKGDVDSWRAHDGQHLTVAAMPGDIWFPSDVSLPVNEPRTSNAIILG